MVVFSGTNNATAVTVSQGTLQVTNSSALGTGTYAVNSGSLYLNYAAAAAPTWANISGSGTLELNSAQTVTGLANWTPGGFLSLPSGFTGTLQLDNGRVSTTPYGLGSAASVVISNSAQFLAYDGTNNGTPYTFPQNFSISGMGWGESGYNNGALRVSGMNATFSGSISLTGDSGLFNQVNGGTLDVTGVISGVHGLSIYTNGSPIIMAGANTYSGTTAVTVGALMLSNSSALENSTLTTGGIIFDAAAGGGIHLRRPERRGRDCLERLGFQCGSTHRGQQQPIDDLHRRPQPAAGSLTKIGTGSLVLGGATPTSVRRRSPPARCNSATVETPVHPGRGRATL